MVGVSYVTGAQHFALLLHWGLIVFYLVPRLRVHLDVCHSSEAARDLGSV